MDKSYNIVATELLDLVKSGFGITQAMRKLDINNSDLVVCLNKNAALANICKEKFNITVDGLAVKTTKTDDEKAQLRARAEQLGLNPHSQLGVAKLKKLIEDKEAELAAAADTNTNPGDPATPSDPDASQDQTTKTDDENGQDHDNSENTNNQDGGNE